MAWVAAASVKARQVAVVPLFWPLHVHAQGPLPVTLEAVPVLHKPLLGALCTLVLLALPHTPLMGFAALVAMQVAAGPPLLPAQLHAQGPLPVTREAVPVLHRPLLGALNTALPLALPQLPLTFSNALQLAAGPPLLPAQLHAQGPLPVTREAVPVLHKLVVGAVRASLPLAVPQLPLTFSNALQLAAGPPLLPAQLHAQGPLPVTREAVPVWHKLVVGAVRASLPLALPQLPLTFSNALQLAVLPPLLPAQLHAQGPLPVTREAVPVLHKLVVGAVRASLLLAVPQAPFTLLLAVLLAGVVSGVMEPAAVTPPAVAAVLASATLATAKLMLVVLRRWVWAGPSKIAKETL